MEWINDSACNVTFADAFSAKRALMNLGVREGEPETPWYEMQGSRSLRFATEADVKPAFFDAQPAEERKYKEKKFGPVLKKTAAKKERIAKADRRVEIQIKNAVIAKNTGNADDEAKDEEQKPQQEIVAEEEEKVLESGRRETRDEEEEEEEEEEEAIDIQN